MWIVWLNGTIGSGKSTVGAALGKLLPNARFLDGDDLAGPEDLPYQIRWRMAVDAAILEVKRGGGSAALVIAYPLSVCDFRRVRAVAAGARRSLFVVNLAPPIALTLRGRGGRSLDRWEKARVREMWSQGYQRRPFADLTLRNTRPPVGRTARAIVRLLHIRWRTSRHSNVT